MSKNMHMIYRFFPSSFRCSLITRRSFSAPSRRTMATSNFSAIADEVKFDIISKTHAVENATKRKEIARTFISDTVTVPTDEMYSYATLATLGDDVYFEPSTAALEAHVAKITGKEAGLFLPSGTASNQIALRTHLKQPPYSILCDHRAHIYKYEAGGAAFHSGAAVIAVVPSNKHHLILEDVKDNIIISNDTHFAPTEVIVAISDYVHSLGLKLHLDGARIWHVAAETSTPLKELCDPFDSVSLCLSKGLGAPVGTVLVGTKEFITKARWFRKLFGGGMRQTGILAASAAYALSNNFPQLPRVHALAKKLEAGLEEIGCAILSRAETCMIFYDPAPVGVTFDEIGDRGAALPEPLFLGGSRLVVHIQTSESAVEDFLGIVRQLAEEKRAAGFVKPEGQANGSLKDVYVRRVPKTVK
ncbi:pyridoxal phosphate-dependent transferase [Flammula alnicola]|nr:pyridoxal phosphate-dependent transferase [Flammula alnicola]